MALPQTGPTWVGRIERREPPADLAVDPRYNTARLLVTAGGSPVGLVTVGLRDGTASAAVVADAVERQIGPDLATGTPRSGTEPLTVVIATRNRSDSLRRSIRAVLAGDHPAVTVLVVDNDPADDTTAAVVAEFDDPSVVYVREMRRGLSVGRNRGLAEARTRLVAFTDDDTEVDGSWAARIAGIFAEHPDLACLSGPVIGARLETPEELAAEHGLVWNKGFVSRRFSLVDPPAESAIFPFSPGLFGIGANFAVRADIARAVGGFDEALGAGAPTRGGEDCEFMVRVVLAGHVVSYEPDVFVWHHHRGSPAELRDQLQGYAMGLGGFLTKIALDRRAGTMALRRLPAAVSQLRHIAERESVTGRATPAASGAERLRWIVTGGSAYVRGSRAARRGGGRIPPLTSR